MDPALLLGGVIGLALTAYALMGGADYGGGVWDLAASGPTAADQRLAIARAIGPIWEANHVWLILVVTVLFSAFSPAFARITTYLHMPLMLALVGIILRGSAFMFRAYGPEDAQFRRRWGLVFAGASVATPVLLGVVVGAITEGRIDPNAQGFAALYVRPWLTPFAWSVGVFALVLFSFLAAVYLTVSADAPAVVDAFRARALVAGVATGALALAVLLLAGDAPHVQAALTESAWAWPLHVLTGTAAVAALALLWTRRFAWARVAAALQVTGILWGWALAQYPYLVRPDIRLHDAAAPRPVLVVFLWILSAGALVLIPSLVYLFRIFAPHRPPPGPDRLRSGYGESAGASREGGRPGATAPEPQNLEPANLEPRTPEPRTRTAEPRNRNPGTSEPRNLSVLSPPGPAQPPGSPSCRSAAAPRDRRPS